ncbi:MAG: M1 family aminopeptidase [Flavobacteriaceae bacterium]|nr:M1 family aminopeptidase [Flavobacteriaceae bacterium]
MSIDISNSSIGVENQINLPDDILDEQNTAFFYLNKNLKISKVTGGEINEVENDLVGSDDYIKKYRLVLNKSSKNAFSMVYQGVIIDDNEQTAADYARGFSETKGTITDTGIYLAGSTYWLPKFEKEFLSAYELHVEIDKDWSVVSQGERLKNEEHNDVKNIVYSSPEPMDEVYLVAAKWTEYSKMLGDVEVQAFLRTPDQALADQYLNISSEYLQMYNSLIGDYPYTKFALVENFWETGYGMPSFTLLGEKIIRFPWILYSSYPHELLHNYWGNSVFVDYSRGNWCEGITAYMADHLLQEQRGGGATYRRNTLQKYTDYVNDENDMPVNKFMNRNNAAEEAIGYGKVLMMNHMLRRDLGDETFIKAYQKFYTDNVFSKASFTDIQKSFEEVSNKDLSMFFSQWIDRKGAPAIHISNVNSNGNTLSFILNQSQKEAVFNLNVPVAIYTEGNNEVLWKNVVMNKKEQIFSFELDQKPLKIEIDPQFDIMRRLDRKEVPASLSQVFGETASAIILPSNSKHKEAYQSMAETWKASQESQGKQVRIMNDADLMQLPVNESIWILGFENKFYGKELQTLYKDNFDASGVELINKLADSGALVYAMPNAANASKSVGFVGANSDASISALTRKLLHYGKYGYLGFEGDDAKNILKGSLPALDSPLSVAVNTGEVSAKIMPRKALYESEKPQH